MHATSISIKLSDAEIRTAIALYLQKNHPGCQGFDLELIGQSYIEPGELIAKCKVLPDLDDTDIAFGVRIDDGFGGIYEFVALCRTEAIAHETGEEFLGKPFKDKVCTEFEIIPMKRNSEGVWEQL
ncbi:MULTISPECIES: hypothetical protein [Leptolyngbya]|uniref:hypothetical protein n=1 Tax=Leptolyngbya TaxID=47251 RepID=UPI0016895EC9|nr:hypothetical protein [Leptolyngbya sp. FACHB-1624]MBD1858659.1 hypothetical protein [Leptolyngbya sp. FACHB-1624]